MTPPPSGTIERWCFDFVASDDLAHKLAPPPFGDVWEESPAPRRLTHPGRPASLVRAAHGSKSPGPEALRNPAKRAQIFHTFFHHELQAAELMAWAVLAFPDTPRAFRRGLIGVALDEIRHMHLYRDHLAELGFAIGAFPVRDWFWERVPAATTPAHFVAVMGIGFEGGNLDHTLRFAERLRAVGDEAGARIEEQVAEEEIPHVRFAIHWFERFVGRVDFDTWMQHLPPPLSPIVMRGKRVNRAARARSGLPDLFLDDLERWQPHAPGF
jgi:uncharacterized ferritin-like protein (DUF455 family)